MSAIPELEQALVDAAQRHYRARPLTRARRRVARPVRMAAAVMALVAVAAVVVEIAHVAAPPREERPAPSATPAGDVFERDFAVFRRPRRASDALPSGGIRPPDWDVDRSRLVTQIGRRRVFLVPAKRSALCIFSTGGGTDARASCTKLTPDVGDRHLFSSWTVASSVAVAVFRDGIANVTLTLSGGNRVHRPVRDNALVLGAGVAVSWNDTAGRHHAESLADPARCPLFEPLPHDALARARGAALAAQPRLYPQTGNPRVVSVAYLRRGMRGADLYTKCGAQTGRRAVVAELRMTPRTPSASLSQGTLLLGQLDGRMTVWELLH